MADIWYTIKNDAKSALRAYFMEFLESCIRRFMNRGRLGNIERPQIQGPDHHKFPLILDFDDERYTKIDVIEDSQKYITLNANSPNSKDK
ncbi:hypothetical protein O9G_004743 [Rozella allomycis CSF55]|uniref:Uncharacterized protein n=1 Tax=Rozella allomycis (strain CSF55) TaxID=988480 RepID=A0A075B1A1_ROZAC|nr:hypothetical protein O9G_004743 [Rozella allomycis CSF55]|eukprot:EPZ36316.1 hypothetical protein O9G_004743 [Rozella allomycis CSF55]